MSARTPTAVLDDLPEIDAANVVRCARVLLRRPLLHPDMPDGDLLPMIYRHRRALQDLFADLLGYRLVVERRFARLHKAGPGWDPTRGERSLTPRGYAYFALALAALTGIGRQVLLSRLVAEVRAAAGEAGVTVADTPADRRALTAALRHLANLGVITETEGSVSAWARDTTTEALITVDTDLLGHLLSGPLAEADTPAGLIDGAAGTAPVEQAVRRRLVEDPVVHYADLPPEQADWLRRETNQAREFRLLERCFGLVTEARLEGVAVTDPEEYLTDLAFPSTGTVARITQLALPLLLAGAQPRASDGRHPVLRTDVRAVCSTLVSDYPSAWSRQATEDLDELTGSVLDLLRRLQIATHDGEVWLLSPAAHRWAPVPDGDPERQAPPPPAPEPPGLALFDAFPSDGNPDPPSTADTGGDTAGAYASADDDDDAEGRDPA